MASMRIVSVSDVARYLKGLMDEDYALQDLWVRGEVSNFTQSAAGHRYFSLKDEGAVLRCALFNGRGTPLSTLRNGAAIFAHGRLSVYEARGELQFYVDAVEDAGVGALHQQFEALKARLEAQGLFAQERKRPLPDAPKVIGVVTSPGAAALRDIVRTLRLRSPLLRVIFAPALVQGVGAAEQVASAIDALNAQGLAEVIIVARGGGSIEELWAFNEEVVAHAIARSRCPVVSGVGHETDFTIADFVADVRASTPTAAATLVAPDQAMLQDALAQRMSRLDDALQERLGYQQSALETKYLRLRRAAPVERLSRERERMSHREHALDRSLRHAFGARQERLGALAARLDALSPLKTLGRGYAIVRRASDGRIITSVAQAPQGTAIQAQVADGVVRAVVGDGRSQRRERPLGPSQADVVEASLWTNADSPGERTGAQGKGQTHE